MKILLYLWQLPQHLAALLVYGFLTVARKRMNPPSSPFKPEEIVALSIPYFGLCLGEYIFLGYKELEGSGYGKLTRQTLNHEIGHQKQSRYLGPLYLLIVGLPSITRNIYNRLRRKGSAWYYSGWPENDADRRGGVSRNPW